MASADAKVLPTKRKVSASDKRLMGSLALKYRVDLSYVLAVLRKSKWDAKSAEKEIRDGDQCRSLVEALAQEFNRESNEIRQLLDSYDWNMTEVRRFAQKVGVATALRSGRMKDDTAHDEEDEQGVNVEKKKFACTFCPMSFNRMRFFEVHLRGHNGPKPFVCNLCGFAFALEEHRAFHIQAHLEKRFACDLCEGRFTRTEHLIRHLAIHARKTKKHVKQQIRSMVKEITQSKEAIAYKGSIKKAISIANKGSGFRCHLCDRTFVTKSHLSRHMKGSHRDAPLQCNVCNERFAERDALEAHMRLHDKRRFGCDLCGSAFRRRYHLLRHQKSHTREKNLNCDHCEKIFIHKAHLNEHRRVAHSESLH